MDTLPGGGGGGTREAAAAVSNHPSSSTSFFPAFLPSLPTTKAPSLAPLAAAPAPARVETVSGVFKAQTPLAGMISHSVGGGKGKQACAPVAAAAASSSDMMSMIDPSAPFDAMLMADGPRDGGSGVVAVVPHNPLLDLGASAQLDDSFFRDLVASAYSADAFYSPTAAASLASSPGSGSASVFSDLTSCGLPSSDPFFPSSTAAMDVDPFHAHGALAGPPMVVGGVKQRPQHKQHHKQQQQPKEKGRRQAELRRAQARSEVSLGKLGAIPLDHAPPAKAVKSRSGASPHALPAFVMDDEAAAMQASAYGGLQLSTAPAWIAEALGDSVTDFLSSGGSDDDADGDGGESGLAGSTTGASMATADTLPYAPEIVGAFDPFGQHILVDSGPPAATTVATTDGSDGLDAVSAVEYDRYEDGDGFDVIDGHAVLEEALSFRFEKGMTTSDQRKFYRNQEYKLKHVTKQFCLSALGLGTDVKEAPWKNEGSACFLATRLLALIGSDKTCMESVRRLLNVKAGLGIDYIDSDPPLPPPKSQRKRKRDDGG